MTRKQWIGLTLLVFWLTMMGLLLRRELAVGLIPTTAGEAPTFPNEAWMAIDLIDGPRVGQVHMKGTLESRGGQPGQRLSLDAELHLQLSGKATDLLLTGDVWRAQEPPRAEFQFAISSGGHDFEVVGEVANGQLTSEVKSAGETLPLNLPVSENIMFSNGLGTALSFPLLDEGEEFRVDSFDPLTLSKSQARIRYLSRETIELDSGPIETRRLRVDMGGIQSHAWIDESGQVVRAETPVGLVLQRLEGPSNHRPVPRSDDAAEDFLRLSAISPRGQRPFRGVESLRFRASGLDGRQLPVDQTQIREGEEIYSISVSPPPGETSTAGRGENGHETTDLPATLVSFLLGDAFVQVEHPDIRSRALQIVDESLGPWQKALQIHEWVFTSLDKESVMSVPSALEVLAQRRGDCNEHTVLFTALARASGIPTRIAIGLVWSDELDGFYYHAWPEVWIADRWIWMDPTLDQPIADATHIKLLNGGIETWPQLLGFLGNLDLEILSLRGEPTSS